MRRKRTLGTPCVNSRPLSLPLASRLADQPFLECHTAGQPIAFIPCVNLCPEKHPLACLPGDQAFLETLTHLPRAGPLATALALHTSASALFQEPVDSLRDMSFGRYISLTAESLYITPSSLQQHLLPSPSFRPAPFHRVLHCGPRHLLLENR